jgi:uncharacterized coiled-coil protein SlyX
MSLSGNSYYEQSMNGIITITDGSTTIENGSIDCQHILTDSIIINNLGIIYDNDYTNPNAITSQQYVSVFTNNIVDLSKIEITNTLNEYYLKLINVVEVVSVDFYTKNYIDTRFSSLVIDLNNNFYDKNEINNILDDYIIRENLEQYYYTKSNMNIILDDYIIRSNLQQYYYSKSNMNIILDTYLLTSDFIGIITDYATLTDLNDYTKLDDLSIGTVTETSTPTVTVTNGVFSFGLQRGLQGAQGGQGDRGPRGFKGDTGDDGQNGNSNEATAAAVASLAASVVSAEASIVSSEASLVASAAASTTLALFEELQPIVAEHTIQIDVLSTDVNALQAQGASNQTRFTAIESNIATNTTSIEALNTQGTANETRFGLIETNLNELNFKVSTIEWSNGYLNQFP